ncbi:hypothetical protein SDC9_66445 [bioreactor metagenome]|uniref:Peptidase A2 domain-containing protein n=1 Tax=bioreactor metagenome TaxID=1076179 RepID=A0A644XW54_9ZZZZ
MKAVLPLRFLSGNNGQKSHIVIDAVINGLEATLIIDSGASNCVIDSSRALIFDLEPDFLFMNESAVGLGSDSISSSLSRAITFELGDFVLERFPFVLLDLGIINDTFRKSGCSPVDGIIGTDLLLAGNAIIDYKSATISFSGNKRMLQKFFRQPFIFSGDE